MKIILFGASGMVGQGVLRACLADPEIDAVLSVGRGPCGVKHAKLGELVRSDLHDYEDVRAELTGYDACFFCLGVSAAGLTEEQYNRITFDLTLSAAKALSECNPNMTLCYVSGSGTDETEKGRTMWARVKGKTENHLLAMPFEAAYMFRPAFIKPMDGIKSKTRSYRIMYSILGPLYPLLKVLFPRYVTTTTHVGRAMIEVAKRGYDKPRLENHDINAVAGA